MVGSEKRTAEEFDQFKKLIKALNEYFHEEPIYTSQVPGDGSVHLRVSEDIRKLLSDLFILQVSINMNGKTSEDDDIIHHSRMRTYRHIAEIRIPVVDDTYDTRTVGHVTLYVAFMDLVAEFNPLIKIDRILPEIHPRFHGSKMWDVIYRGGQYG